MFNIVLKIALTAGALLLAAYYIPGISIESYYVAFLAALVLGLLNIFLKPILTILTLPINLVTLGLFSFVLSAGIFAFTAYLLKGFAVAGFMPALIGSFVVSMVSTVAYRMLT
jgi:putative membrane protein